MNSRTKLGYASALVTLALVVLFPAIAKAADFSGKWAFAGTLGDPVVMTMAGVCTLTQDGDAIVGSCKGPWGVAVADGSVDGHAIDLRVHHVKTHEGGSTGIAEFKGVKGSDGIIRGRWVDSHFPGAWGTFTGQPVD